MNIYLVRVVFKHKVSENFAKRVTRGQNVLIGFPHFVN